MESDIPSFLVPMTKYKIVFLGDVFVGKTSIITRFIYDTFDKPYQSTVGIDFLSKTLYLGDQMVRMLLWDTAGQERFRSLIPNYIRDSSVAVIVFDVTDKDSFHNLDHWIEEVRRERAEDAMIIILGNKIDKSEERVISSELAATKAEECGGVYIETSAKTGKNIEEIFSYIGSFTPENTETDNNHSEFHINNTQENPRKCNC